MNFIVTRIIFTGIICFFSSAGSTSVEGHTIQRDPFTALNTPSCTSHQEMLKTLALQGVIGRPGDWQGWFHSTHKGWTPINIGDTAPFTEWQLRQQTQNSATFFLLNAIDAEMECQFRPVITLELDDQPIITE